jgi:hypothetical protein
MLRSQECAADFRTQNCMYYVLQAKTTSQEDGVNCECGSHFSPRNEQPGLHSCVARQEQKRPGARENACKAPWIIRKPEITSDDMFE